MASRPERSGIEPWRLMIMSGQVTPRNCSRINTAHIRTSLVVALLAAPLLAFGTAMTLRTKPAFPFFGKSYIPLNSQAYGSMDNFDAVNDTGSECHGFEIEINGCRASEITYTYDWNHYGVPRIVEDISDPANPKVYIRYESGKNQDGSWKAYTAIPSGPISPTDGHLFTDPSINFGGEHFGVGFYGAPTSVKYSWLKDDGAGNLTFAGAVDIGTPTFNYIPPAGGAPPQVIAAIVVPPPPAPPALEFGDASWVKMTRTTSHKAQKIELEELIPDDPNHPEKKSWRNGEPDEVEVEWKLMQTEFKKVDGGANNALEGAPQDLNNGDEVVTVRYDFYKYAGPIDLETGEAKCDSVGIDDIHGNGTTTINGLEIDLSAVIVVGDYVGAQMAGFDAGGQLGLIRNLQPGDAGVAYPDRRVVIGGVAPVETTVTGNVPPGMVFDTTTGLLVGTPERPGTYKFTVNSKDASGTNLTKAYTLVVTGVNVGNPPISQIAPAQDGTWNKAAVDVMISAAPGDGSGPVAGIGYAINGGDILTVDGSSTTVTIASEGSNFIFFWAYDTDGNVEDWQLAYIPIDSIAPVTTAAVANGLITLDAVDDPDLGSGIDRVWYRIDGGAVTEYTAPLSDNIGIIEYWAVDNAGNVETRSSLTIKPVVSSLVLNAASVVGGTEVTATVTLVNAAPPGGADVVLTNSNVACASVPVSVTIPAGSTTATFTIGTTPVAATAQTTVTAKATGAAKSASLAITAAVLSAVSATPSSLTAGDNTMIKVSLSGPAPVGGIQVALTSSKATTLPVAASVIVAAGQSSASVNATAPAAATAGSVTVTAKVGATSKTAVVTVTAMPKLGTFAVTPATVVGGTAATATVTLTSAAPAAGLSVTLASSNTAAATVPVSVMVPGGGTTATVTVTTKAVTATAAVTLTATAGAVAKTAKLSVTPVPAVLSNLTVPTSSVSATKTVVATVTLSGAAPTAGATVMLTASPTAVGTVPVSVNIASGKTSATFTITTKAVSLPSTLTVNASFAGITKSVTLTVQPARVISAISIAQTSVKGGTAVAGTVTLTGPATEAVTVTLKSSATTVATVPVNVVIPIGASSAAFTVTTKVQTATKTATLTGTTGTTSKTVVLSVTK